MPRTGRCGAARLTSTPKKSIRKTRTANHGTWWRHWSSIEGPERGKIHNGRSEKGSVLGVRVDPPWWIYGSNTIVKNEDGQALELYFRHIIIG